MVVIGFVASRFMSGDKSDALSDQRVTAVSSPASTDPVLTHPGDTVLIWVAQSTIHVRVNGVETTIEGPTPGEMLRQPVDLGEGRFGVGGIAGHVANGRVHADPVAEGTRGIDPTIGAYEFEDSVLRSDSASWTVPAAGYLSRVHYPMAWFEAPGGIFGLDLEKHRIVQVGLGLLVDATATSVIDWSCAGALDCGWSVVDAFGRPQSDPSPADLPPSVRLAPTTDMIAVLDEAASTLTLLDASGALQTSVTVEPSSRLLNFTADGQRIGFESGGMVMTLDMAGHVEVLGQVPPGDADAMVVLRI